MWQSDYQKVVSCQVHPLVPSRRKLMFSSPLRPTHHVTTHDLQPLRGLGQGANLPRPATGNDVDGCGWVKTYDFHTRCCPVLCISWFMKTIDMSAINSTVIVIYICIYVCIYSRYKPNQWNGAPPCIIGGIRDVLEHRYHLYNWWRIGGKTSGFGWRKTSIK